MSLTRMLGLAFANLAWVSMLAAQVVTLPPIQEAGKPEVAPPPQKVNPPAPRPLPLPGEVLPTPRKENRAEDVRPVPNAPVLPPPKQADAEKSNLTPPTLGAAPQPGSPVGQPVACQPLLLQDVLTSLDRHYPLIYAAEQERMIASGGRLAAEGAFDHKLVSPNYIDGGTFANQRYGLYVEQQTPFHGLSYFAGYRAGIGRFPVYYEDRKTGDGGEFRAGVMLPLLRDREIDRFRATLAKADVDVAMAEPKIQLQRIDIARAASFAYWIWVASGQRLLIAREILRLAELRDDQLNRRIRAGNLAPIEREDNRRIIIDRQARVVVAQRGFQQASILLSIYLRDAKGDPMIPRAEQLPAFVEPPSPPDAERRIKDLEAAMANRPEIRRVVLQQRKVQIDLDLAQNQLLPGLNVGVAGAQDFGQTKKDLYRTWGQVGVLMDVPLERRQARGKILSLRAEMAQLLAQERFARDRVQVEVQNALNGLDRAFELLQRGRDKRKQNQYLADAERRQFEVGKSDLFRVNIRELDVAEAKVLEIDAAAEFYRALADYHAAVGLDSTRLTPQVEAKNAPPSMPR